MHRATPPKPKIMVTGPLLPPRDPRWESAQDATRSKRNHESHPIAKEFVRKMKEQCSAGQALIEEQRAETQALLHANKQALASASEHFVQANKKMDAMLSALRAELGHLATREAEIQALLLSKPPMKKKRRKSTEPGNASSKTTTPPSSSTATPPALTAAPTPAPPPQWDLERCGPLGHISNLGRRVHMTGDGWNVVVAAAPVDLFRIRMTLPPTPLQHPVAIGFIWEPNLWKIPAMNPHRVFAFHKKGWFLDVQSGALCSRESSDEAPPPPPPSMDRIVSGDVISVSFDLHAETIVFAKNGASIGTLRGVNEPTLFPAVVAHDEGVEVEFLA
ncbi:Aste57867_2590 [Aphanomyces stellatus]|uniref:Aste57867_2590 protein n=1 Tax=Aphanomyces stellatus TaxID=120398 RepID=A0A485KDJ8_9STRA|nr:hypothetical protein As57867_002583 [Aphanomyces stellatus]VFT79786.1 Aste57867_2590 [Aphanomyces stellatus]